MCNENRTHDIHNFDIKNIFSVASPAHSIDSKKFVFRYHFKRIRSYCRIFRSS